MHRSENATATPAHRILHRVAAMAFAAKAARGFFWL